MSIRTWVFLALLAMTLLGMGGISAAHAEDIDCDNGRLSNDDSDTADCIEERKRVEREEKESGRCPNHHEPYPDDPQYDLDNYDGVGQDRELEQPEPSSCDPTPYPCGTGKDRYIMCY
jgi:hypothetical protein